MHLRIMLASYMAPHDSSWSDYAAAPAFGTGSTSTVLCARSFGGRERIGRGANNFKGGRFTSK